MSDPDDAPRGQGGASIAHIGLNELPTGHPVARMAQWWTQHTVGDRTPLWSAFDPVDHRRILPWILLLRPMEDGRLKYVVSGSLCDAMFGFSYLGKVFGDGLPPAAFKARQQEFDKAVATRTPLYSRVNLPIEEKEFILVYRGVFPFLTPAGDIERILVVIAPVKEH